MAPFDRVDTTAPGQFALTEFESTGERGEFEIGIPIEIDATMLAVILEGDVREAVVEINGERVEPDAHVSGGGAWSSRLFVRAGEKLNSLRVRVWTHGERARVAILRVLRQFGADLKRRISCTGCKRLVRFLVTWILTGFGVPHVPWDGPLPVAVWDRLREFLAVDASHWPGVVARLLSSLHAEFVEQFLKALRWALAYINVMYEPLDRLLEAVCRYLGFCAEHPSRG